MQYASVLNSKVLVLNKLFMALHIVTARRAFTLLFKECAEVVSVDDGEYNSYNFESWKDVSTYKIEQLENSKNNKNLNWLKTFSLEIEVPKIIRLLIYDKFPKNIVKFNRKNVFARDNNTCQYCGKKFPPAELSLEHVVPKSQGGENGWTNIVCACTNCNKRKGSRTPKEAGFKLICKPIKPKYNPVCNLKFAPEKYDEWETFINNAYWSVPLK